MYIDSVIARDRSIAIKPDLLGERTYYAQNWRGDVVQLIRPNGMRAEANRYSAYGRPFNIREADFDGDGVVDLIDLLDFLADWNTNLNTAYVGPGDHNMDGFVDLNDSLDFNADWSADLGVATGRDVLTAGETRAFGGNRKGYAAYEHEPWWFEFPLSGTPPTEVPNVEAGPLMQLARHRFYRADLGTWTRRDPLGYVDGPNEYIYAEASPLTFVDPEGLFIYDPSDPQRNPWERPYDPIRDIFWPPFPGTWELPLPNYGPCWQPDRYYPWWEGEWTENWFHEWLGRQIHCAATTVGAEDYLACMSDREVRCWGYGTSFVCGFVGKYLAVVYRCKGWGRFGWRCKPELTFYTRGPRTIKEPWRWYYPAERYHVPMSQPARWRIPYPMRYPDRLPEPFVPFTSRPILPFFKPNCFWDAIRQLWRCM